VTPQSTSRRGETKNIAKLIQSSPHIQFSSPTSAGRLK
jgi:hypothetical protein